MQRIWHVFLRLLVVLLAAAALLGVYFSLNPAALGELLSSLPLPGVARLPEPGPTPPAPAFAGPPGALPTGNQAFYGLFQGGTISCGFLIELPDGRLAGISAAHASAALPPHTPAEFHSPDGVLAARLEGQVGRGSPFVQDQFAMDYVIWAVAGSVDPARLLQPDQRGQAQPGERVLVYSPFGDGADGPRTYAGVVMHSQPEATWIQLDDSFSPNGFSGCPVISQYSGSVIGMAVAGADKHPVVMGLHPIGSLVEKAQAALGEP